jgi:hemin uptake protein HemP
MRGIPRIIIHTSRSDLPFIMDPAPANKPPIDDRRVNNLSQPTPILTSPTLFGDRVKVGDTFWWGGALYTIKTLRFTPLHSIFPMILLLMTLLFLGNPIINLFLHLMALLNFLLFGI